MIVQFTLIPFGTKSDSLSGSLTKAMKLVVDSGLDYQVGSMGTTVEGEWEEVMSLINETRKMILKDHPRVSIIMNIDDRKNAKNRITGKVQSLEAKMGVRFKK